MSLISEHAAQQVYPERLSWAVEGYCYSSSILMTEALMASSTISQDKTVSIEYVDYFASGRAAKATPRNRHVLNSDSHSGFGRNNDIF